jgi:hypothetical protein
MAPGIHMPSSFVERCPSLSASYKSKAEFSGDNRKRMFQDLTHLQQQNQQQAQMLQSSTSIRSSNTAILGHSLQTKKASNVAFHNGAAECIFNLPSAVEATNTNTVEQEPPVPGGIIRVPCRARGMPKDHIFKVSYICCVLRWVEFASSFQHST